MGRLAVCRASVVALVMATVPLEAKAGDGSGDAWLDIKQEFKKAVKDPLFWMQVITNLSQDDDLLNPGTPTVNPDTPTFNILRRKSR